MRAAALPHASPLQSQLARQILALARSEGWPAGTRLIELQLAKTLGVSRTPVRGALALLQHRGLVAASGRGFVLTGHALAIDDPTGQELPSSETERLYHALMADRARGTVGREVSETELLPRYATSRGTLRRVLMRFASEGLAERQKGHGWRFAETLESEDAIDESYSFRLVVECAALREPGYAVEPNRYRSVREAHEAILAAAPRTVSHERWFEVNAGFHEAVAGWSGNRFFLQAVRQQNSLRRLHEYAFFGNLAPERIAQSCREHLGILQALQAGDQAAAEARMRAHLEQARASS